MSVGPSHPPSGVVDFSEPKAAEEEVMPSTRCPHCRVMSSYDQGGENKLFKRKPQAQIRFDQCRNEECRCNIAVVFDNSGEIAPYPSLEEEPDELLPENARIAFRQALRSLNERIWDGCVGMCRRALEEAMTDLSAEGRDLRKQIDNLADARRITPDFKEWAHEGRLGGNLAVHGSREQKWNTEADAEEIVEFGKWLFRYACVFPLQLEQRTTQLAEEHGGEEAAAAEPEAYPE